MSTLRTLAERIKHARTKAGLTQRELAAGVARLTGARTGKATVSSWELGVAKNPSNPAIMAIQSITGYRAEWLVNGTLPEKVTNGTNGKKAAAPVAPLDTALLTRAIEAAAASTMEPARVARTAVELYGLLLETPSLTAPALARIAALMGTQDTP